MNIKGNLKSNKQYIPINTRKYVGKYPIYVKSTWEEKFARWLDYNDDVLEWSSESIRIAYIDPTKGKRGQLDVVTGKRRTYYPDFYAKFINGKKYLIEIKPNNQTRLPKKGNKSNKTIINRTQTYLINEAKFKSAKEYCKKLGMTFLVLTEHELFRKR